MATQYRIIKEGQNAFYIEASRSFLFFTRWVRLRDYHAASHKGYSYAPGSYVRYQTAEAAAEAIKYLQAAAVGYASPSRTPAG